MNVNIELSVDQVNYIISALSKHPYEDVADLINTLHYQAVEQITATQKDAPAEESDSCGDGCKE